MKNNTTGSPPVLLNTAEYAVVSSSQRLDPSGTITPAEPLREPELLTVRDAARLLNVTVSWVYEHSREAAEDRLPFVKLGKYVRFDRTDLREYVNAKRHAARTGARRR